MNDKIKKISKKLLAYILVYIGITVLFLTMIYGAYALPDTNIRGHIVESIPILENEGEGYSPFFRENGAVLDTFTDKLILNIAANKSGEGSTLKKAVENSYYANETGPSLTEVVQDSIKSNHEYSRYWHGIQVIIRPLLLFFNYIEIRYILMLLIVSLIALVCSMIGKQVGTRFAIAFGIAISMMYIVIIPMSMQYSTIFIVKLCSIIAVLFMYKKSKEKYLPMLFFVIGACSTFFDLLTYPLITLGIPLVLAVILENRKKMKLKSQIIFIIKLGILWAIGYGLLFFTKWLIATIILQRDAIKLAIENILFRVNGSENNPVINRMDVLKTNFDTFFVPVAKYIIVTIFAIWVILFALYKKSIKECKVIIPLLCISIVPYIWYFVFSGHSSIHFWFTNRIQVVTIFSLLCAILETIDKNKFGKYVRKLKEK